MMHRRFRASGSVRLKAVAGPRTCGMSAGYENLTASYTRTGQVPLDEMVTFVAC